MMKSAEEVAHNLQNHVFSFRGTPRVLHSDYGREFVNEVIHTMVKVWPGEVVMVNGRPRNAKCQGLIEQGSRQVEKLLGARHHESEADIPAWTEWLPLIQCKGNMYVRINIHRPNLIHIDVNYAPLSLYHTHVHTQTS